MACRQARMRDGHFSRTAVARRLKRPTREGLRAGPARDGFPCVLPAWSCSRWGLPSQAGHPACWCALTAPFHPCCEAAVCFLLHFPCPCGRWALPTTVSCGARTFLPASLSASPERPSGRLTGKGWGADPFRQEAGRFSALLGGRATRWCGPGRAWQSGSAASPASTYRRPRRRAPGGNGVGTP